MVFSVLSLYKNAALSEQVLKMQQLSGKHGRLQINAMLQSQPQMSQCDTSRGIYVISAQDKIWQWTESMFEGSSPQSRIFWSLQLPGAGIMAEGDGGAEGKVYFIRVANIEGSDLARNEAFEKLWYSCVYELNNSKNYVTFTDMKAQVFHKKLSRTEFLDQWTRAEYRTLSETQAFYKDIWLPWASNVGMSSDEAHWLLGWKPTYAEWVRQFDANGEKSSYFKTLDAIYDYYLEHEARPVTRSPKAGKGE